MDGAMIFLFVGIAVFIGLVGWLALFFIKRNNAKYTQLWSTLAGTIQGSAQGNKLTGTYNGVPVQARINSVSDDNSTDYYYELTVTPGMQGKDWSLSYTGDKMLGLGAKSWHVKTKDEALKQRLMDAGAIRTMDSWQGHPSVVYKAKNGALKYETKVNGMFAIPSADEFKAQLDLLTHLGTINGQANVSA